MSTMFALGLVVICAIGAIGILGTILYDLRNGGGCAYSDIDAIKTKGEK
jgi:hypothetical protein